MDSAIGHEYQVIDDERHADAKIGPHRQTAAFYDVLRRRTGRSSPAGQFNQSRVVSNGTTVEHWLNGTSVLQYELDSPALRAAIAKSKFKDVARFGKLQNGSHPAAGPRRPRLVPQHQDPAAAGRPDRHAERARRSGGPRKGVQVVANEAARRVDVTIDGKPFTSYIYPDTLKKPVLFPIRTSSGTLVTRGFPLEPRAGERVDHPHHVGLWFNHGDVNGLDFWNNSDAIPADRAPKMGTIRHKRVVEAKSGADRGELVVEIEWLNPRAWRCCARPTRFVFRGTGDARSIDRITTLTALDQPVVFRDNKEGVARTSRRARARAAGRQAGSSSPTPTARRRRCRSSTTPASPAVHEQRRPEGRRRLGHARPLVHARAARSAPSRSRSPCSIIRRTRTPRRTGTPAATASSRPTCFGRKVFDPKQEELVLTLEPGKSVTFRHRILILDTRRDAGRRSSANIRRSRRSRRLRSIGPMSVVGRGVVDGYLTQEEVSVLPGEGLAQLPLDGKRVLVLIPDGTRTMPMPLMFDILERELAPRVAALDYPRRARHAHADERRAADAPHRPPGRRRPRR